MALFLLCLALLGGIAYLVALRPGARDRPSLPWVILLAFFTGAVLLPSWIVVAFDACMWVGDLGDTLDLSLACFVVAVVVAVVGSTVLVPCWGYLAGRLVAERRTRKIPKKAIVDEW